MREQAPSEGADAGKAPTERASRGQAAGEQGPGEQGPGEQGPGEQGPGEQTSTEARTVAPRVQAPFDEDVSLEPPTSWSRHVPFATVEGDEVDGRTAGEIAEAHAAQEAERESLAPVLGPKDDHDADSLFADQDIWEVEHDAEVAAAAFTDTPETGAAPVEPAGAPRHRVSDDLSLVRDGGYGVGSAAPLPDGVQPLGHPVKAVLEGMTFHEPGSAAYLHILPDVWFTDAEAARRCGFRPAEV